jgi:hypothetical protein
LLVIDLHEQINPIVDREQAKRNAAAIALLNGWLQESERGIDEEIARRWEQTKVELDTDRLSGRKLFP